MSLNDTRVSIFTFLNNNFSAASIDFDGSNLGDSLSRQNNPWVHIYIVWGGENQKSMGTPNAKFERIGVLAAKLYTRISDGIGVRDTISDTLLDLLRAQQLDGITFYPGSIDKDEQFQTIWDVRFIHFPIKVESTYLIT